MNWHDKTGSPDGTARGPGARNPPLSHAARRRAHPHSHFRPAADDPLGNGPALPSPARAVKAKANVLPRGATAEEAFRLTLERCRQHIALNVPAVLEARDAEGVHQLRVALRRLRVALAAFGEEFREPPLEALRMRAKILAQSLAPARDLDVFIGELFEPAAEANGSLEAFAVLRERALAARHGAWAEASREVSGLAFRSFLHDLGEAVDGRFRPANAQEQSSAEARAVFARPAASLAARMLSRRLKVARKRAQKLAGLSEAERHKLRIALKTLRYTAEFFAPLYPAKDVVRFLKRLGRMQDILGLLQDVAVARATLGRLIEEAGGPRADLSFAAGIVYGWHLDRASHAWKDAVRCWKKFVKTEPFWLAA